MSMGRKLIQKLAKRAKQIKESVKGFDQQAKADKSDEVLKASPGAYKAMLHTPRKADRGFGVEVVGQKPRIEYRAVSSNLERFDYGGGDFGTKLEMPAGVVEDSRVQAGDQVLVLQGALKGEYLEVVDVVSDTELRLEDKASFSGPELDVAIRFQLSSTKKSYI